MNSFRLFVVFAFLCCILSFLGAGCQASAGSTITPTKAQFGSPNESLSNKFADQTEKVRKWREEHHMRQ
jgi:hypothetical protein